MYFNVEAEKGTYQYYLLEYGHQDTPDTNTSACEDYDAHHQGVVQKQYGQHPIDPFSNIEYG